METMFTLVFASMAAGTPLVLAGLGELVTERTGVLNLGVEGMMLMGAAAGFVAGVESGSLVVGFALSMGAGLLMALGFAALTLGLQANQVASGLALTIFGLGASAYIGLDYTGESLTGLAPLGGWLDIDVIALGAPLLAVVVARVLYATRLGTVIRAIGESPAHAHAHGLAVLRIRLAAVLFGGALAGLAGGYLSLVYTPLWSEGMTAGRGWIALALVVFATWRPGRLLVGAYLFGGITIAQLHLQGQGVAIPAELLSALPYLITIVALVLISRRVRQGGAEESPRSLGQPFHPRSDG